MMESIDKMSFLCKTLFDVRIVEQRKEIEQQRKEIERYKRLMKTYFFTENILTHSVYKCDLETVKILLDLGYDPNSTDGAGHSALMNANSKEGKDIFLQMIHLLIGKGANVNYVNNVTGDTALMYYVYENDHDAEGMSVLLDYGADIDFQDNGGCTSLMIAVQSFYPSAEPILEKKIRLLLDRGTNLELRNKGGQTAYDFALYNRYLKENYPDILKRLQIV